jgi:hypothetical protein
MVQNFAETKNVEFKKSFFLLEVLMKVGLNLSILHERQTSKHPVSLP